MWNDIKKFIKDTFRGLTLKDFWIDKSASVALMGTFALNTMRSMANVFAPVFMAGGLQAIADRPTNTTDPKFESPLRLYNHHVADLHPADFFFYWGMLLGLEQILKITNELMIAKIQIRLSEELIVKKFLPKIHLLELEILEDQLNPNTVAGRIIDATQSSSTLISSVVNQFYPLLFNVSLALPMLYLNVSDEALVAVLSYLVYNLVANIITSYIQRSVLSQTKRKSEGFANVLNEDLRNIESLRAYRAIKTHQQHEIELFEQFNKQIIKNDFYPAVWKLLLLKSVLMGFLMGATYIMVKDDSSREEIDTFVLVVNYCILFHNGTEAFGSNLLSAIDAVRDIRWMEEIDENSNVERNDEYESKIDPGPLYLRKASYQQENPVVEFLNVSYIRKKKVLLNEVSFKICKGQTLALVGESGSGKSTITKLLSGLYKPTSGTILIQGHNILDKSIDWLRQRVTLITQETQLFSTMENEKAKLPYNIMLGYANRTLTTTDLHVLVDQEYPRKIRKTLLSKMSPKMEKPSGGERQRIGLARGWRSTPLIVLDEPTSALDAHSQQSVIDNFNHMIADRSDQIHALVITAHQLKTIKKCHQILFLAKGCCLEKGTHEELMAKENGKYARYYNAQNVHVSAFGFFKKDQEEEAEEEEKEEFNNFVLEDLPLNLQLDADAYLKISN